MLKQFAILALVCAFVSGQTGPPQRKVAGNVITSKQDPAVRIEVPEQAQYVGADRFVLLGMADCELHAFVEADAQKRVQRLYWVQFEQYLPSRPEMHHTYDSPQHATMGGMDFYVNRWVRSKDEKPESGSDLEHILGLVQGKGYRMPEGMMYLRLVHLLDRAKRKELMIIYAEDLGPAGFTAADLGDGGRDHDRWPGIAQGLLERAEKRIRVAPTGQ